MKSSNFPPIIFILIALLYIGVQKIDCQRNRHIKPPTPRPYENIYQVRKSVDSGITQNPELENSNNVTEEQQESLNSDVTQPPEETEP